MTDINEWRDQTEGEQLTAGVPSAASPDGQSARDEGLVARSEGTWKFGPDAPSSPAPRKRAVKKTATVQETSTTHDSPATSAAAHRSLLATDLVDGTDGMPPRYDDGSTWLRAGLQRHTLAVVVGLVLGWSGIWIAFWGAMGGAIIGVLIGAGLTSRTLPFFNSFGAGQTVSLVSAAAGFFVGALGGLIAVVIYIVMHPITLVGSLIAGSLPPSSR